MSWPLATYFTHFFCFFLPYFFGPSVKAFSEDKTISFGPMQLDVCLSISECVCVWVLFQCQVISFFFFCSPNDGVIINYSMPVMAIVTFAFAE